MKKLISILALFLAFAAVGAPAYAQDKAADTPAAAAAAPTAATAAPAAKCPDRHPQHSALRTGSAG